MDFIFRYCNAQMAVVEGVPIEEMLNRSFYKVFSNGDKKWLVAYADVALNGTKHTLHDYSPEINKILGKSITEIDAHLETTALPEKLPAPCCLCAPPPFCRR